jgi:hypothetical protein
MAFEFAKDGIEDALFHQSAEFSSRQMNVKG